MTLRPVRIGQENRTYKHESDLLVRESEAVSILTFRGVFKGLLGPHFVHLGTNVKRMVKINGFTCVSRLQNRAK